MVYVYRRAEPGPCGSHASPPGDGQPGGRSYCRCGMWPHHARLVLHGDRGRWGRPVRRSQSLTWSADRAAPRHAVLPVFAPALAATTRRRKICTRVDRGLQNVLIRAGVV